MEKNSFLTCFHCCKHGFMETICAFLELFLKKGKLFLSPLCVNYDNAQKGKRWMKMYAVFSYTGLFYLYILFFLRVFVSEKWQQYFCSTADSDESLSLWYSFFLAMFVLNDKYGLTEEFVFSFTRIFFFRKKWWRFKLKKKKKGKLFDSFNSFCK